MLGSDTTMGLSWRRNTVGCTVEPLDGYGWFLGSLICYAPFSAGSDSLLPWKERKEIWAVEHILCPRAMPSAPPCRARLELVVYNRAEGAFPGTSADNRSRILVCPRYISLEKVSRCSLSDRSRVRPAAFGSGVKFRCMATP